MVPSGALDRMDSIPTRQIFQPAIHLLKHGVLGFMTKSLRYLAMIRLLALGQNAYAIALIPTNIHNDCPVPVRIVVARMARCLGPEKGRSGPWEIKITLAPQQDGTILLMGGVEGLCSGWVRSITIETAPTAAANPSAPSILPLSITGNFPNHWLSFQVQIDAKTRRFVLRAVNTGR